MAPFINGRVLLYCDNIDVIAQVKESKSHQCTKYILCCYHLIQKIVDQDNVELQKIDGKKNLADPFTKALDVKKFDDHK